MLILKKMIALFFYRSFILMAALTTSLIASEDIVIYREDGTPITDNEITVSGTLQEHTAFERIFWNKTPIAIALKTGVERMIHFPDMVRVMPPKERTGDDLKISVVDNVVYLKALKNFSIGRMRVQMFNHTAGSFDGGVMYLIDLSAQKRGGVEQIKIIDKTSHTVSLLTSPASTTMSSAIVQEEIQESQTPDTSDVVAIDMVDLVRYASQQLYAPERLMPSHPSIYRTPLRVKSLQSLYRGGELQATPLASWKGAGLYVTAVKIQNKTAADLTLDPRLFRGQWRSRTLQHPGVSYFQSESDTTTVYLVSDRPFHESLWF